MSQNVGEIDLSLILNSDKFSSQLKSVEGQANQASSKISTSLLKIGKAIGIAFSVKKVIDFGKACVNIATETSNAWIGLNSILTGQGKSFSQAQKFIQDYVSDGLVPLNNAVGAYKNLALRGYSSEQIQKTMTALKNSATFARQSTYSLGDAVQTATEGLKNENSVVVDNAGVTKNVAKMWEDYAKSIGKTTNQLTQAEKIEAEVNGILEETKFQSNDAAIYANTYAGKLAQLNSSFANMKVAIGNVIQPIAKLFIPMITAAANAVTKLFTAIAGMMSVFGLKADSVETVSNGIGNLANNADNTSNAIDDIGKSAANSAKKLKKLASFDTAQVLSSDSDKNSANNSLNNGVSGLTDTLNVSSVIQEDTNAFNGLINRVRELANIFKEGFKISFGNINFEGILTHLGNIKNAIVDIFTDSKILNSVQNWIDTLLYSLGQIVGSIARIGANIVESFVGSIDNYLSQNVDRIKRHICNMFEISSKDLALTGNLWQALGEISDIFSGDTAKQIGSNIIAMFTNPFMSVKEYWSKLAFDFKRLCVQPIIDNVSKIKEALENTLKPIQTITEKLANGFTEIGDNMNKMYDEHLKPMFDSLTNGFSDSFGKLLDVYNQYIAPTLQNMADKFTEVWDTAIQPMFEKAQALCGSIGDAIKVLWETILKPTVDWFIQTIIPVLIPIFEAIWNTICNIVADISNLISGIIDTFKGLIDFIVGIFTGDWNKAWEGIKTFFVGIWDALCAFVKGIVDAIILAIEVFIADIALKFAWIATKLKAILEGIKTVFINIWNEISSVISNVVSSIKNTIVNTFKNAYNSVTSLFNNLKSFFSNIWNSIKNTFTNLGTSIGNAISNAVKSGINNVLTLIQNTINKAINLINGAIGVINSIPGVNISKLNTLTIPKLAQGGYVKANTPQLAMIGDNKYQGEFVAPEDKLRKLIKEETGSASNNRVIQLLNKIAFLIENIDFEPNMIVDGYKLNKTLEKIKNKNNFATNGG